MVIAQKGAPGATHHPDVRRAGALCCLCCLWDLPLSWGPLPLGLNLAQLSFLWSTQIYHLFESVSEHPSL